MLLWRSEWKGLLNTRTTVSTSFYEWQMIPRASWSTQNVMRVGLVKTPLDPLSFAVIVPQLRSPRSSAARGA